jgi:hypothetical protein
MPTLAFHTLHIAMSALILAMLILSAKIIYDLYHGNFDDLRHAYHEHLAERVKAYQEHQAELEPVPTPSVTPART